MGDSMPSSDELEQMKQNMYPCMACFCAEQSCTGDITPLCFTTGKVCCCVQSVGLECPPLWCEPDPCHGQAKISEWVVVEWAAAALLTTRPLLTKRPLLSECLPAVATVPVALTKQAKIQSTGLHTRASSHCKLLLWGATPPWQVAISSCPVRLTSCLICSWISSSSAASAVRLSVSAVSRHKALVLCIVSRCLRATRG